MFFDKNGVVHSEFVPEGQIVNDACDSDKKIAVIVKLGGVTKI